MWKRKLLSAVTSLLCGTVLLSNIVASAVQLPDGAVKGLPEKLTVMDSEGNSANSQSGEYFFHVENMVANETYSKNIQIINLREDKAYHIYFYAEPISKDGNIDLEEECEAVISLSGEEVYRGKVTGDGNVDLTSTPLDLGLYTPGESRVLNCQITWHSDENVNIDYGEKLVDADGTHVIREGDSDYYGYGEVTFKWIFYAVVDETYVPPKTGILGSNSIVYAVIIAVCVVMVLTMLLLIAVKKRKSKGTKES
jgi:hypothetical protein